MSQVNAAADQVQQQQVYLEAMGIQRWLPRRAIAAAPAPAAWVAEFVWPPAAGDEASQPLSVARSSVATETPVMPSAERQRSRQDALASLKLDDSLSVSGATHKVEPKIPAAEVDTQVAETPVEQPQRFLDPAFSLVFVPAGDLLLIDSLPPHAREAVNPAYRKLLSGVCRALGNAAQLDAMRLHHWPVFAGSSLNQGGEEAQRAVRRQLEVMFKAYPARRILLLGEPAAQWLLEQDQPLEAMRGLTFSLRTGVTTVVSYSITHMLKLPEFKVDCWQDLQTLL